MFPASRLASARLAYFLFIRSALCVKIINEKGGVYGRKKDLVIRDAKGKVIKIFPYGSEECLRYEQVRGMRFEAQRPIETRLMFPGIRKLSARQRKENLKDTIFRKQQGYLTCQDKLYITG